MRGTSHPDPYTTEKDYVMRLALVASIAVALLVSLPAFSADTRERVLEMRQEFCKPLESIRPPE
jgi:hypothetical protein